MNGKRMLRKQSEQFKEPVVDTSKIAPRQAYSISLITQKNLKFFSLSLPTDVLFHCCRVTRRQEDPSEGYQRVLDKKRALEIAEYIDNGLGTIPNSVILSAQVEANLEYATKRRSISFDQVPGAFFIIDGQHRVYGYGLAKSTMRVPVVIYNGLSREQETRLFIDINTKQRPVPNELLLDIKTLANYENQNESICRMVFDLFSRSPESPLIGLLSPSERLPDKISRVTFNRAIMPLLSYFSAPSPDLIFQKLSAYLQAFLSGLGTIGAKETITKPVVFHAIMALFEQAAIKIQDKNFTVGNFKQVLNPIFQGGRSGVKASVFKEPGKSHQKLKVILEKAITEKLIIV